MLQLVLDTNVLVAGLRSMRGASYRLLRLFAEGSFRVHVSVALALEYEDVLKRPGLITGITTEEIDNFLDFLFREGNLEQSVPRLRPSLRDPDDERILELAVQCGATIVTHNARDFDGAGRFGVHVYAPSDLLRMLENRT